MRLLAPALTATFALAVPALASAAPTHGPDSVDVYASTAQTMSGRSIHFIEITHTGANTMVTNGVWPHLARWDCGSYVSGSVPFCRVGYDVNDGEIVNLYSDPIDTATEVVHTTDGGGFVSCSAFGGCVVTIGVFTSVAIPMPEWDGSYYGSPLGFNLYTWVHEQHIGDGTPEGGAEGQVTYTWEKVYVTAVTNHIGWVDAGIDDIALKPTP